MKVKEILKVKALEEVIEKADEYIKNVESIKENDGVLLQGSLLEILSFILMTQKSIFEVLKKSKSKKELKKTDKKRLYT